MSKILIDIKDESKEHMVLSFLKELSFIEIKELNKASKSRKTSDFRKLFGIWQGREINSIALRQEAWQRTNT